MIRPTHCFSLGFHKKIVSSSSMSAWCLLACLPACLHECSLRPFVTFCLDIIQIQVLSSIPVVTIQDGQLLQTWEILINTMCFPFPLVFLSFFGPKWHEREKYRDLTMTKVKTRDKRWTSNLGSDTTHDVLRRVQKIHVHNNIFSVVLIPIHYNFILILIPRILNVDGYSTSNLKSKFFKFPGPLLQKNLGMHIPSVFLENEKGKENEEWDEL